MVAGPPSVRLMVATLATGAGPPAQACRHHPSQRLQRHAPGPRVHGPVDLRQKIVDQVQEAGGPQQANLGQADGLCGQHSFKNICDGWCKTTFGMDAICQQGPLV